MTRVGPDGPVSEQRRRLAQAAEIATFALRPMAWPLGLMPVSILARGVWRHAPAGRLGAGVLYALAVDAVVVALVGLLALVIAAGRAGLESADAPDDAPLSPPTRAADRDRHL